MNGTLSAREAAAGSLLRCEKQKRYSNLELDAAIKRYGLSGAEKALFTRLVYGVTERKIALDHVIGLYSDIPLEKIDGDIAVILRIALYQLYYLDRIPESAIVNEAVESAKRRRKSSAGFANALLRRAVREGRDIPLPDGDDTAALSVRYSLPGWMISMWKEQYGPRVCKEILEGTDEIPYTALAVNTLKISKNDLAGRLTDAGCIIETPDDPANALIVKNGINEALLGEIEKGSCFVQDISSQNAVEALAPAPGDLLIDVCACPGGKSFYSALRMEDRGRIISRDLHENKLPLIRKGAERLGFSIIETGAADACIYFPELENTADKVICDVPCSGLGVISKKPDIRHKNREDIDRLPDTQYAVLSTSCRYLKKGGRLLYSTCTLNKNENENIIERFLSERGDLRPVSGKTSLPTVRNDGFFHAVLERIK